MKVRLLAVEINPKTLLCLGNFLKDDYDFFDLAIENIEKIVE